MKNLTIPPTFYSFETGAPFERCISCEKYLLNDDTEYLIEKAMKSYEGYKAKDVIFDYAICMDCAEKMRKKISKHSWNHIMRYFEENIDVNFRNQLLKEEPTESLSYCLLKKTPINDCREYQLHAHCKGSKLFMNNPPYMISGAVMDELMPKLSKETVDEMNGFFKKHFSPDPSFFEPAPSLILI